MGSSTSKSSTLSIPIVLKRINECVIPDDKGAILDFVEMIDIQISNPKTTVVATQELKEANGILMVLKLMKRMIDDSEMISVCIQVFESMKYNTPLVMDFIQFGGLDLLEKAMRMHSQDDFISMTIPKLLNILLAIGAAVSVQELKNEGLSLLLCQKCQETIERSKNANYFMAQVKVPRSCDRVNRVLKFMDNYLARPDVQVVALDAVINFVRNPDAKSQARETNIIAVVGRSVSAHPDSRPIIWRACMALSMLASFHGELANDIALLAVHEVLVDAFPSFVSAPSIQQQILWLLAAFVQWPKSRRALQRSAKTMRFLVDVVADIATTTYATEPMQAEAKKAAADAPVKAAAARPSITQQNLKQKPGAEPHSSPASRRKSKTTVAVMPDKGSGKKHTNQKGDPAPLPELEPAYQRKEFELVVPLPIKTFLRETGGQHLSEAPPTKEKKVFRARRNFDEKPKFGTVHDAVFLPGEAGLLPTGQEDEMGEAKREVPDWERRLNYIEKAGEIGAVKKKGR